MAILPPKRGSQRRPSMRGNLLQDTTRGVERNRAWPEPRGSRQTRAQREQTDWFRQANWAFKLQDPKTIQMFTEAAAGTSLYPRDIFSIMAAGGLFSLAVENGKVMYPMQSVLAVSESLDVIGQSEGSILYRGADRWYVKPYTAERGPWWWLPPDVSAWTDYSGDGNSVTTSGDLVTGLSLDGGPPAAGQLIRCIMQSIPAKREPWRLTMQRACSLPYNNWGAVSLFLMESNTGKLVSYDTQNDIALTRNQWNSLTSRNSQTALVTDVRHSNIDHWRLEYDGTNLTFGYGCDGNLFQTISVTTADGFLTTTADRIGVGVTYYRSTGPRIQMNVGRWLFERGPF